MNPENQGIYPMKPGDDNKIQKILFVMKHPGYVRNFITVIELLVNRGNKLYLYCNKEAPEKSVANINTEEVFRRLDRQNFDYDFKGAPSRTDYWTALTKLIRNIRDYLRYFHPAYKKASKLRKRAGRRIPVLVKVLVVILYAVKAQFVLDFMDFICQLIEKVVPPDKTITRFIKNLKPDIILITPYVDMGSDQVDYVKSAKKLGIKIVLCVSSWDNLTNKGLVKVKPDKIIVWNAYQREELINFHDIKSEDIVVTGAQCFDRWFDMSNSSSYDEFCNKVNLDRRHKYLLYLCSSYFIAPQEITFVIKWIKAIRNSNSRLLREIGILIRPHPQNAKQWVNFSNYGFKNVSVYPSLGANPVTEDAKKEYFDSVYHSCAVVGINTSSQIEAGILGKPVFTVLDDEFKSTQEGTLHFNYIATEGLLSIAKNLDEHISQLEFALNNPKTLLSNVRKFTNKFVRPYGLNVPATPLMVDFIETFSKSHIQQKHALTDCFIFPLVSYAVYPAAIFLEILWEILSNSGRKTGKKRNSLLYKIYKKARLLVPHKQNT